MCIISVVVPVYNKAIYLTELLNCVLNQSFSEFELLLIDDGSTDESGLICDKFLSIDDRIRVFHKENRGVSSARNFGIEKAIGKYICFIDADDIVEKEYLNKLYMAINNNADLAVCDFYEIKNGKKRNHLLMLDNSIDDIYEIVRYNVLGILWNKLFVKDKIKHFFEESVSTCEDSIFCVRYFLDNRPKIVYVKEVLYGYLRNNEGLTASVQKNALYGINKYCSLYYSLIKEISDVNKKKVAIHSIYKIYFFLICSFIFENLSAEVLEKEKIVTIKGIINQKKYQKIIRNILLFPLIDKRAEKTTFKEYIYIFFSLFKSEKLIFVAAKAKRIIRPFK